MTLAGQRGSKPPALIPEDELHYPSGDGKPMAENDICRDLAYYCTDALGHRYANDPLVYVAGNNFIYYKEGYPRQCISPDVYVVFGAEKRPRRSYMAWKENGILPQVVIEITSASTWVEDERKRPRYARMGVREYFQFDPHAEYLYPTLQGQRLVEGRYQPIRAELAPVLRGPFLREAREAHPDDRRFPLCLHSEVLGLYLVREGEWMRFYDVTTGQPLLSNQERAETAAEARAEAERRAETAAEAREEAERRAQTAVEAHAEAERRAQTAAEAREEAERRAETEAEARLQMEAELVRMRAELEALRRHNT
jgi:Uma2 family endonuclease